MRSINEVQQIGLSIELGICREVAKLVLDLTLFILVSAEMSDTLLWSVKKCALPISISFHSRTIWTVSLFSQLMLSPAQDMGWDSVFTVSSGCPGSLEGDSYELKYWLRGDLKHSACPIPCRVWTTVAFCPKILKTKSDYRNFTHAKLWRRRQGSSLITSTSDCLSFYQTVLLFSRDSLFSV